MSCPKTPPISNCTSSDKKEHKVVTGSQHQLTLWLQASPTKGTACLWTAKATIFSPSGPISPYNLQTQNNPECRFVQEVMIEEKQEKMKRQEKFCNLPYSAEKSWWKQQNQLLFFWGDLWQQILLKEDALDVWINTIIWKWINKKCNMKKERAYTGQIGTIGFLHTPGSTLSNKYVKWSFFSLAPQRNWRTVLELSSVGITTLKMRSMIYQFQSKNFWYRHKSY